MTTEVDKVAARQDAHEQVCAVRYEGINARLKRMEMMLWGACGGTLLVLAEAVLRLGKL